MKRIVYLISACCCLFSACSKEAGPVGDPETVTVDAAGYTRSIFEEGAVIMDDTDYKIVDIHPYFAGFEMLISGRDACNSGIAVTDVDCLVYIIALNSTTPYGWKKITDSQHQGEVMRYFDGTNENELAIYCKRAYAGVPIEYPVLTSTFPAVPLARKIILKSEEIR